MDKKIIVVIVAILAAMMAVGVYVGAKALTTSEQLSEIELANVDALSDNESTDVCRWSVAYNGYGVKYYSCLVDGTGDTCKCGSVQHI